MDIKMLVMDVDGTLTDGKLYIGNQGEIMKAFSIKDGYAIGELLPQYGIEPVIITGRESVIVTKRCEELIIDSKIMGVAYIGDDIQDIPSMAISELTGCPSNAVKEVKDVANYVSDCRGGDGAVRDFIEWILRK